MTPWSIAVKTVGGRTSESAPRDHFTVCVSPDDHLTALYDKIEVITGLKASQQRLIYRGRIINGGGGPGRDSCDTELQKNEPKVKDVIGLCDGQTIHLVPRPETETVEPLVSTRREGPGTSQNNSSTEDLSGAQSGAAGLFAALLGFGGDDDDTSDDSPGQQLQRIRSTRIRHRSRRANYRLTQDDLEVPDPGTMEPVRQGLMTLHTLLETSAEQVEGRNGVTPQRQWYRGQWIDCRDTVNQWLEATIVDILEPNDILPSELRTEPERQTSDLRIRPEPTSDPAVSANDLEGRMKLLLEPAEGYPFEDKWGGYRQRENNSGVHLLLIHYNGWPNRWDEWIRSDSERIRPFRTRTRHPANVCPNTVIVFLLSSF